ncbi:GGDEF domain-containing protein [Iamia sp. SCSIO 61187]|uniref:GGDEF domain-containing protein n=1 Tax=Iamia sp. SCSIO 61187 TaxID=2722752 RepID=UPI001C6269BF|nr:GGDEF domain-containing protein [Iamia sp. SCSIO 61187]QYG92271.1 GGDEF domain-containing protein [Iamia sp. SCSIO 61187]
MDADVRQRALRSMCRKEGSITLLLDAEFTILWHCESVTPILGWDDLRGRSAADFVHDDDLEVVLATMTQVNAAGDLFARVGPTESPEPADIRVVAADGVWHSFEATTYNHLDDPEVGGVLCTCKVVSDRSDVPRAIELLGTGAAVEDVLPVVARLADHSLGATTRTVFAWRPDVGLRTATASGEPGLARPLVDATALVWDLDLDAPLVVADLGDPRLGPAGPAARAAGYSAAFLVPIEAPSGDEVIGAMVAWSRSSLEFKVTRQTPVHVALRLAALAIADGRTKRDLRWAAAHDPLTGLVNRAELTRDLGVMDADEGVVLLYIDLDDFKPVNDQYGHAFGDEVLVEVARRIGGVIGPRDVAGRIGGDEFAVVCAGSRDPVHGRDVADRIVAAVGRPMEIEGRRVQVGASIGVAVGAHPLIPAQLMKRADDALYLAKSAGKNTVRIGA